MNKSIFHEGEYHIQEVMGVRKSSDALSSMIHDFIPPIAANFLEDLKFCVITLSFQDDALFTATVYNNENFIEVINNKEFCINLSNKSYIPNHFYKQKNINIGMIGLEFSQAKRIRVNGKASIKDNKLYILVDEVYSNCPKYINKRFLSSKSKNLKKQRIEHKKELTKEITDVISNSDTFFLASYHKEKGLDVSHKGGDKGFIKIISDSELQFIDFPGNNLYNSIGNIYTNPYINMFFIDFKNNNTYHILGVATIIESNDVYKKELIINITCKEIIINKNSFSLDYKSI